MPRTFPSLRDRFESRYEPEPNSGCWLWTGGCIKSGKFIKYGTIRMENGGHTAAHRAAWLLYCGDIPPGMCVCHKCDNGLCVNPDHLFLGSHSDNMRDMVKKGRRNKKHYHKIDHLSAIEICDLYATGKLTQKKLGSLYGISQPMVGIITRGERLIDRTILEEAHCATHSTPVA